MAEYRFEGLTQTGRSAKGVVAADSFLEARQKVRELAEKHNVKIKQIRRRKVFMYKVKNANGATLRGEQKAYTKEEVVTALSNLGYEVISIQPKINFLRP